jgi:hypothetical protein
MGFVLAAFGAIVVVYPITVIFRVATNWKSRPVAEKKFWNLVAALGYLTALVLLYALEL